MSNLFSTEVLNDGSMPSIDDHIKKGEAMFDVNGTYTATYKEPGKAEWMGMGEVSNVTYTVDTTKIPNTYKANTSITVEDIKALFKADMPQVPKAIAVSPATYDYLKEFMPKWGDLDDNEGLIDQARQLAEYRKRYKMEQDSMLATMESEPIQDRRV